jgi:hypothetical protein
LDPSVRVRLGEIKSYFFPRLRYKFKKSSNTSLLFCSVYGRARAAAAESDEASAVDCPLVME